MMSEKGSPRVLDFGIAKAASVFDSDADSETPTQTRTREGSIVGTPQYMSPEQAEGKAVDHRTDIFSLGIILYEMATGERPFRGDTAQSVLSAIIKDSAPSVTERKAALPLALARLVRRCLAKDAERRYQTAKDVRNELEELKQEVGTETEPGRVGRSVGIMLAAGLALVAVSAAIYALLSSGSEGPTASWEIKPLATLAGREGGSTWSPDGSMFAYNGETMGSMDLFVMSTSGGEPIRLTDTPFDELTPRWSPDGRSLAFVSDRGSGLDVYVMPPLGGGERKVAETGVSFFENAAHGLMALGAQPWSPEGRKLLFPSPQSGGASAIWQLDMVSGDRAQLTKPPPGSFDLSASWSFDGASIVFQRHRGLLVSLRLTDPQGDETRLLLGDEYRNTQPGWSADSRRVTFMSNRARYESLWDIDVASGQLRQLIITPGAVLRHPVAARDGRLAYSTFTHETDLYLHRIGSDTDERLTFNTSNNFEARFSPNGSEIVYQSDRAGSPDLWVLDLSTGEERQLTEHPATDITPDWSPDGREIVFLSNRDGEYHLWIMDAEGGGERRITEEAIQLPGGNTWSYSLEVRWSPDGAVIGCGAQVDGARVLLLVDRDGRNPRTRPIGSHSFDWYRDSRHVVYNRTASDGVLELVVANLATGDEALLQRGPLAEVDVAPDGKSLIYLHAASHWNQDVYRLRLLPPSAPGELPRPVGEPERLTFGGNQAHAHGGSWSPDGSAIVYTRDADEGDVYVVENYK